ncbi:hypothetical protein RSAG8_13540, partial [Rhizoctonia solani AG-8 WAC10335]
MLLVGISAFQFNQEYTLEQVQAKAITRDRTIANIEAPIDLQPDSVQEG